jgi:AcrR family transcriptional regulator
VLAPITATWRSVISVKAVLDAALALASEEGPGGLNMEAIAKRAGVSKETLYHWWRSKSEVILDALAVRGRQTIPLPDIGTLREDLRSFLRATVDSADATTVQLLHAVAAAAASDEAVAVQVRDRFLAPAGPTPWRSQSAGPELVVRPGCHNPAACFGV